MESLGKILLISGLVLAFAGVLFLLADKVGWLGRLPGDIVIKRENFTFYLPLTTGILISVVLSLLFWLFRK